MRGSNPIGVDSVRDLQLHIYTIGYYPMGECILILVYEKGKKVVHKSILIDCFKTDQLDILTPILDKYNIIQNGIDFIIWTHPDKDHSMGYDNIVSKYVSPNTCFFIPNGINNSNKNLSSEALNTYNLISAKSYGRNYCVTPVGLSAKQSYPPIFGETEFRDGYTTPLNFHIEILTPILEQSFRKTVCCAGFYPNDISISINIHFGNLRFYFGGDTEDSSLDFIDDRLLRGIDFIKIPHHASSSSTKILEKVNTFYNAKRPITAVSTEFVHGRAILPENETLKKYELYCDRVLVTGDKEHNNKYGVWKVVYNIQDQELYRPEAIGDASIWYEDPNLVISKPYKITNHEKTIPFVCRCLRKLRFLLGNPRRGR